MNTKRILGLAFLVALSACKGQCSCGTDDDDSSAGVGGGAGGTDTVTVGSNGTGTGTGGTGDGGAGGGGTPATTTGAGGEGGGPTPIVEPNVRFVNVATNVDELNFCLLNADDEVVFESGSVAEPGRSEYATVGVGNYSVVVVAGGAQCDDADGISFDGLPLADGGVYSLALVGNVDGLALETYNDDLTLPAAGSTRLRLVHAAEGAPNVDVGVYEGDQFVPFFTDASFPNDSGYTDDLPAFAPATIVARAAGTETDLLEVPDVEGTDGQIVNAYAWGNPTDGVAVFIFNDGAVD